MAARRRPWAGNAYAGWLKDQPPESIDGIKQASLDPFRGYANALRDELPDAVAAMDGFHVVILETQVVDEVRRVQQDTCTAAARRTTRCTRSAACSVTGENNCRTKRSPSSKHVPMGRRSGRPGHLAWHRYQQLRSVYQTTHPVEGRRVAERFIVSFPNCPIREVARLVRTLKQWKQHVLAPFGSNRISNGGTEAVNLVIERTRRRTHGIRTFERYRLRILFATSGTRSFRRAPAYP